MEPTERLEAAPPSLSSAWSLSVEVAEQVLMIPSVRVLARGLRDAQRQLSVPPPSSWAPPKSTRSTFSHRCHIFSRHPCCRGAVGSGLGNSGCRAWFGCWRPAQQAVFAVTGRMNPCRPHTASLLLP